jgi:hypothetical protein
MDLYFHALSMYLVYIHYIMITKILSHMVILTVWTYVCVSHELSMLNAIFNMGALHN